MDNRPNTRDMVLYVTHQRALPAVVIMAYGDDTADLVVFGTPDDGREYASGACPLWRVPRGERPPNSEYPPVGTWFNN